MKELRPETGGTAGKGHKESQSTIPLNAGRVTVILFFHLTVILQEITDPLIPL